MQPLLLLVQDLDVEFQTRRGRVEVVQNLNFAVRYGEALGIVGESGSGKSVTAHAIMNLLPANAKISGVVELGRVGQKPARAAMIFQDPMTSLNPCYTIEYQIAEAFEDPFLRKDKAKMRIQVVELLQKVGIPDAESRIGAYPHQLSGGISQRVMIAMALAMKPDLLIADEPTTALDVTIQAQILELLHRLRIETGMSLILISHDLGVISQMVDRVMVMYAGRCVESGAKHQVALEPLHPYTKGLLKSLPAAQGLEAHRRPLPVMEGLVPNLQHRPSGCQFNPRCFAAKPICAEQSPPIKPIGDRRSECHFAGEL